MKREDDNQQLRISSLSTTSYFLFSRGLDGWNLEFKGFRAILLFHAITKRDDYIENDLLAKIEEEQKLFMGDNTICAVSVCEEGMSDLCMHNDKACLLNNNSGFHFRCTHKKKMDNCDGIHTRKISGGLMFRDSVCIQGDIKNVKGVDLRKSFDDYSSRNYERLTRISGLSVGRFTMN